jgi:amino acid transporter
MSFSRATPLATMLAGRYRPGQHRDRGGFLQHVFATSPWLGVIVITLIVIAVLVLASGKAIGRVLDGTPWYVRLALLATTAFGILRVLNRKSRATPEAPASSGDGRSW